MKKQELIHLHGLLAEVSRQYEAETERTVDLADYETLGVQPTSIHRSKHDHKEAVFALIDGITADMTGQAADASPAAAD